MEKRKRGRPPKRLAKKSSTTEVSRLEMTQFLNDATEVSRLKVIQFLNETRSEEADQVLKRLEQETVWKQPQSQAVKANSQPPPR